MTGSELMIRGGFLVAGSPTKNKWKPASLAVFRVRAARLRQYAPGMALTKLYLNAMSPELF